MRFAVLAWWRHASRLLRSTKSSTSINGDLNYVWMPAEHHRDVPQKLNLLPEVLISSADTGRSCGSIFTATSTLARSPFVPPVLKTTRVDRSERAAGR